MFECTVKGTAAFSGKVSKNGNTSVIVKSERGEYTDYIKVVFTGKREIEQGDPVRCTGRVFATTNTLKDGTEKPGLVLLVE